MTTIAKDFAAKASVAFVAVAMVFTMLAPAAQAQSAEDLQTMINSLLAQIATLQGQLGQSGTVAGAGVCPFTWTRDLSQGATGADVMKLQQFLNSDPNTRVAAAGAGSVGAETQYYGPATAAAVSKFQVKFRAEILSPVNLVNPTGYFGPSTRAKANAECVVAPTTPPTTGGGDDDDEDEEEEEEEEFELGGEGQLEDFEMDDASDTDVQEGAEDVEIGEVTMEATNGDLELDRMTFTLDGTGNTETDPWDVFDEISLWVDGEKVADFEADDEDNYLDEDTGKFRFSNLGLILEEDEEVVVTIAANVANSVDGAGTAADWTLTATEVRHFDADGVATDDTSAGELPTATATFEIVEEGEGEELQIKSSGSDPDATTFVVDASTNTNNVEIHKFDVEADENDITLERMVVLIETGTASTTGVVRNAYLTVGGKTFTAETIGGTAGTSGDVTDSRSVLDNADGLGVWYSFDIDGDVVAEEDDRMEVVVSVDLKAADGTNYSSGETIQAKVDSTTRGLWDAEGSDDLASGDYTGTATGDEHRLQTSGIVIDFKSQATEFRENSDATTTDNQGIFTMVVEVTALETDVWIDKTAATGTTATTSGAMFRFLDSDGNVAATDSISPVLTSSASTEGGQFVVREGETKTFTLTVTADPSTAGDHRIALYGINYETNDSTEDTTETQQRALPTEDFESAFRNI